MVSPWLADSTRLSPRDVMTNQQCVDFVRTALHDTTGPYLDRRAFVLLCTAAVDSQLHRIAAAGPYSKCGQLSVVCEAVVDACLAEDPRESRGLGTDNMTCLVVLLGGLA